MQDEEEKKQDRSLLEENIAYLRANAAGDAEGLYGPESITWLINREATVLLGGLRAILLQIAHPLVAEGVSANSSFRTDILGRARRTFSAIYQLSFGHLEEAIGAAKRLHNLHERTRGVVQGAPYRANDPKLLFWVLATLVDTSPRLFETFHRPLTQEEKDKLYQEVKLAAAQFAIPRSVVPNTMQDFEAYFEDMMEGNTLRVEQTALELSSHLFHSPFKVGTLDEIITAGFLTPRWRSEYQLRWGPKEQTMFGAIVAAGRAAVRVTPERLRFVTAYHQAKLRVALSRGERPSRQGRFLNWLGQKVPLPFTTKPVAEDGWKKGNG
jgi:uncharacterized protein (DUF2236 family)